MDEDFDDALLRDGGGEWCVLTSRAVTRLAHLIYCFTCDHRTNFHRSLTPDCRPLTRTTVHHVEDYMPETHIVLQESRGKRGQPRVWTHLRFSLSHLGSKRAARASVGDRSGLAPW
ncbi:hypothetical protein JOQ06_009145, partial [Pogonophryne albipinna]